MVEIYKQHTGLLSPFIDSWRIWTVYRKIPKGVSILDLGCGPAFLAKRLNHPKQYVGVDSEAEIIEANQLKYKNCTFICSRLEDIHQVIFSPFEAIVLSGVLEHLNDPKAILIALHKHLGVQGRLYLTTPTPLGGKVHAWAAKWHLASKEASEDHKAFFDKLALTSLLEQTGWKVDIYFTFEFGMNQLLVASSMV